MSLIVKEKILLKKKEEWDSEYWPPLRGEYVVCNKKGSVAVVFISDLDARDLPKIKNKKIAIYGRLIATGQEYIIYNIVSNPYINTIVITPFITKNDKENFMIVGNDAETFKPREKLLKLFSTGDNLPSKIYNLLQKRRIYIVNASECENIYDLIKLIEKIASEAPNYTFDKFAYIELPKYKVITPSSTRRYGIKIEANNIVEAYLKAVYTILTQGEEVITRHGKTYEVKLLVTEIENQELGTLPKVVINYLFDLNYLEKYVERVWLDSESIINIADKEGYSYGDELFNWGRRRNLDIINQIDRVVNILRKDLSSRAAYCLLGSPMDSGSKNAPCLVYLQFFIRHDELNIFYVFRSHDILRAFIPNLYAITKITKLVRKKLEEKLDKKIELGKITGVSVSAHIYERDLDIAYKIKNWYENTILSTDYRFVEDRSNIYFLIFTEGGSREGYIVLRVFTKGGEEIISIREKVVESNHIRKDIIHKIALRLTQIVRGLSGDHLIYLGKELMKAATCLKYNKVYIQDHDDI